MPDHFTVGVPEPIHNDPLGYVAALEETGRLANTLIFFLADNGGCAEELYADTGWLMRCGIVDKTSPDGRPMQVGNDPAIIPGAADTFASYGVPWANASNTPFRLYKHWVHEGGVATPLIVHWPRGIEARGQLRRQPGHLIDIMATCLDVAQIEYPNQYNGRRITPIEGKSLRPAFANKPIEREAIYFEHEGNRAVRAGKWKLVAQHGQPWELYDLESDRTETDNLADKQPDRVEQMRALYQRWANRAHVHSWPLPRVKKK